MAYFILQIFLGRELTIHLRNLSIGDKITVKVLSYDKEKMRVSLGLKQLTPSPWDNISERLPMGKKVSGVVSNLN